MKNNFIAITVLALFGLMMSISSCEKKVVDKPGDGNPTATIYNDDGNGNITITDKGEGTGNYTFTSDKTWILDGMVFVNDGQTLTIEAGTLIKGKPGTAENASALVVARGGKIMAEGTADAPIVMTAQADNYEGTIVNADEVGLWGGLVILGKATTNNATSEKAIEGIPTVESRGLYGGTDDADNSGTIKYVSIRHGGTNIGEGNEINGLTLGAVGSATIIDYIEIVANADDGIEFFGGAAFVKHALIVNCGDDSFDYDEGFHGKGQFWLTIQNSESDRGGEHDGGPSDNETGLPYALPQIYNATYIAYSASESKTVTFRDNAGGIYANSIFQGFAKGLDIEYLQNDEENMVQCSFKMWEEDYLNIKNNVFANVAGQSVPDDYEVSKLFKVSVPKNDLGEPLYEVPTAKMDAWLADFASQQNTVSPTLVSPSNPIPNTPQTVGLAEYPEGFEVVDYKGACGNTNWAQGWTLTFQDK